MAFTFVTYTDITPSTYNTWTDVDVSALVPSNAVMVMLYAKTVTNFGENFGVRKKGSTDNRITNLCGYAGGVPYHLDAWIGLDENRVFQAYISKGAELWQSLWLKGYATDDDVVMFDDGVDLSPTINDYYDIDISAYVAEGDDCIGAIFEIDTGANNAYKFSIRKNGSSDDFFHRVLFHNAFLFVSPVDEGFVCEGKRDNTAVKFYLLGYVKSGILFHDPAIDFGATTGGWSWKDLTALPNSNVGALIEQVGIDTLGSGYGLRKNGYTGTGIVYGINMMHTMIAIDSDSNSIIEAYISADTVDLYLRGEFGYFGGQPIWKRYGGVPNSRDHLGYRMY
jgi:hypothetical protein